MAAAVERDRKTLNGSFAVAAATACRPGGHRHPERARMSLLLRGAHHDYLGQDRQEKMGDRDGRVQPLRDHCPYGLDKPQLLKDNWEDYRTSLRRGAILRLSQRKFTRLFCAFPKQGLDSAILSLCEASPSFIRIPDRSDCVKLGSSRRLTAMQ